MNSRYIAHTQTASTLVSFFDWQKGIMLDWTIDLARALSRAPMHGIIWMNEQTLFFYDHKDNVSEEVVHGFHIGHLLQEEGNEAPTSTNEPCKFYTLKRAMPDGASLVLLCFLQCLQANRTELMDGIRCSFSNDAYGTATNVARRRLVYLFLERRIQHCTRASIRLNLAHPFTC